MVWHNTSLGMDCFDRSVTTACNSVNKSVAGDVVTGLDYDTLNALAAIDLTGGPYIDYDTKTINKITIGEDTFEIGSNVSIAAVDDLKTVVDKMGARLQAIADHAGVKFDKENNVIAIEKKCGGMGRLRRSQLRTL